MRFLHTSDWHLGRSLHRASLADAQAAFLDHLVETVKAEQVDAVLVAGDIYDRAIPSLDAVARYEDALARLRAAGARVVLISGNHDSARRLGVNSALIDASGVHLRTRPTALDDPIILTDKAGEVAVYGIPYLEPALAGPDRKQETEIKPRSHASVLGHALDRIRADAAAREATRTVVLAHAWVAGGQPSASERDISVGGIGHVHAGLFDGVSYAALGHLHGPQALDNHLRYSGSPLPYSFSEKAQQKGSWLVELAPDGEATAEWVKAPVHRQLAEIGGRIDDLLTSRAHDDRETAFLAVTVTDTARPQGAMERLRARFPHILTLEFKPAGVTADPRSYTDRVSGRDDLAVAAEFVTHVRQTDPEDHERDLFQAAFAAVRLQEASR